ncbi:MAG TPA: dicarboxylate/amino acid:cation symporter [Gammaproteobacteria bacterium]|nr:dicarboxylate/amino acid:cation symporter [Gammaproteobacteria bacterium]MEC8010665.1 dicarboxylate/amino acid:cation symporter [Pseudomonadota bacterium]HBF10100.1 dicarboxylate/amino acid:cation symporter [Gammaproteobacteria bacterium]HCK94300.1 dicarboxylate/amino acid:cation symporter [Gammaproteobacteria bacterium]|tara:strand:- start:97719 stop:99029 length:1311 start_codon:yes stop_codon:yes gene_type:complete
MTDVFVKHKESSEDQALTRNILYAMVAAIVLGCLYFEYGRDLGLIWFDTYILNGVLDLVGEYFVRALKFVVVPLVMFSLISGLTSNRDPNQVSASSGLGKRSFYTIALYLGTTLLAITLALTLALIIDPGQGVPSDSGDEYTPPEAVPLMTVLKDFVPTNMVAALAGGNMIPVIFISIVVGISINMAGEPGRRVASLCQDINEVVIKLILLIMTFAPYGVFALVFQAFADKGTDFITSIAAYFLTITAGLVLQLFVVYLGIVRLFAGVSPLIFLQRMKQVMLFAFGTASSAATISLNLKNAIENFGVRKDVASFTIPLGATVNMDGTSIMQGVAVVFIASAFGVDLTTFQLLEVVFLATLASVGTAAVPSAGLVTLSVVLLQVNLPVEAIGLIIGVDRLLDMMRTAVNVAGDAAVTLAVARKESALDDDTYNSRAS